MPGDLVRRHLGQNKRISEGVLRYDILFHNNLSLSVSPHMCVHSVFAHSKPTLQM